MKILNIHGYKGSAENSACLVLKELGHNVISPQIDYDAEKPDKILADLRNTVDEIKPDYIVGTSFGGFFALLLSIESGIPVLLVNPCIMPFYTLPEMDYNGDISVFIRMFSNFAEINQEKTFVIIGSQDEIINYHNFTKKLIHNYEVVPDGRHSGATLPLKEYFSKIIK